MTDMTPASGPPSARGLGPVLAVGLAAALVMPAALITLPLALLLVVSGPGTYREQLVAGAAAGYSLWWLFQPGSPPDQLARAGVLLAAAAFVTATVVAPRRRFIGRALLAVGTAAAAVYTWFLILGRSWSELRWWIAHRAGLLSRELLAALWSRTVTPVSDSTAAPLPTPAAELDTWLQSVVSFLSDHHPGILALEVLVGLAVATALQHRIARRPRGRPLERLRAFRFSDHLGWAAAIPVIVLLIPKLAAAKAAAANLVLVVGALYALRGLAVAAFGLAAVGAGGVLTWVALAVVSLLLLPAVLGGVIILGVLDSGLDFRRRWAAPPAGE